MILQIKKKIFSNWNLRKFRKHANFHDFSRAQRVGQLVVSVTKNFLEETFSTYQQVVQSMSLQDQSCCHISSLCTLRAASVVQNIRANGYIPSSVRSNSGNLQASLVCVFCVGRVRFSCAGVKGGINGENSIHRHTSKLRHYLYVREEEPYELFCVKCGDYCYSNFYDFLINRKRAVTSGFHLPKSHRIIDKALSSMSKFVFLRDHLFHYL